MATDAQRRAVAKYDAANTRHYGVKFNLGTDADIILLLDTCGSKQGLLKLLLREYIEDRRPGVTDEIYELYAALKDQRLSKK